MFVLFTSHRDVRAMAAELRARGAERRWPVLVHGDESRDSLLGRFRDSGGAILLGTSSFWEGVDVPGDALRALLIAKLPFRVPTEPITAAHCEAISERGGDPFVEYMLPHAALRLKQGFGRLIRERHGSRRRGHRRSARRHQGVRPRADRGIAARAAPRRRVGGVAAGDSTSSIQVASYARTSAPSLHAALAPPTPPSVQPDMTAPTSTATVPERSSASAAITSITRRSWGTTFPKNR